MRGEVLISFVMIGASLVLSGCRDPIIPAITELRFDGQSEDSPLVLLFSVDFEDADGNLADGKLETFIDQQPTGTGNEDDLPKLLPLFVLSDVARDATEGTFGFVLELSFGGAAPPPSGTAFSIGARVYDEATNVSDTEEIRLQLLD